MKGLRHKKGIVVRDDEDEEIDVKLIKSYLIDKYGNKYNRLGELITNTNNKTKE